MNDGICVSYRLETDLIGSNAEIDRPVIILSSCYAKSQEINICIFGGNLKNGITQSGTRRGISCLLDSNICLIDIVKDNYRIICLNKTDI